MGSQHNTPQWHTEYQRMENGKSEIPSPLFQSSPFPGFQCQLLNLWSVACSSTVNNMPTLSLYIAFKQSGAQIYNKTKQSKTQPSRALHAVFWIYHVVYSIPVPCGHLGHCCYEQVVKNFLRLLFSCVCARVFLNQMPKDCTLPSGPVAFSPRRYVSFSKSSLPTPARVSPSCGPILCS